MAGMSQGLIEQCLGLLDEHGLARAAPKKLRRRARS
jgi:hypothetical protein